MPVKGGRGSLARQSKAVTGEARRARSRENLRSVAGVSVRERYMLSYLSREQKKKWDSYSLAMQRRIFEQIESRLGRRMENPFQEEESESAAPFFDLSLYEDKSKRAPKLRTVREDLPLRKSAQQTIRKKERAFSAGDMAGTSKKVLFTGKAVNASAEAKRRDQKFFVFSGKSPDAAKAMPGASHRERGAKGRTVAGALQTRQADVRSARDLAAGKEKEILDSQVLGLQPDEEKSTLFLKRTGKTAVIETAKRQTRDGRDQRSLMPAERDTYFPRQGDREEAIAPVNKAADLSYDREPPEGLDDFSGGAPVFAATDRKRDAQVKAALGKADENFQTHEKEELLLDMPKGRSGEKKEPDWKNKKLREKTIRKEAEKLQNAADKAKEKLSSSSGAHSYEVIDKGSFIYENARRPQMTVPDRIREKDPFVFVPGLRGAFSPGRRNAGTPERRSLKEKRKRAYERAFLSELVSIIERDIQKDKGISQAQKSGQISASVAKLTGESAKQSVKTAALPFRVMARLFAKRLREEFKNRLKVATANALRALAAVGGPLFVLVLIILLLGSICVISTTQQQSARGTGLGAQIVQEAKKHLGLPYVYGGTSLVDGCDCSGFVWAIYNIFGYNLPRTAGEQYAYGREVGSDVNDWQLGDLIYYSRTGSVQSGGGRAEHIVIYIGGGQVISCGPVAIYNWDYRSDYYGTCRIIPDEPLGGDFSGSTNEEICWNYFISQGFSEAATAGILGNMYVESGGTFDPSIHQYGGGPGRGLCQWEESYSGGSGRYNNLVAFAQSLGKEWDDITAQLQFVVYELDSGAMNPYFSKFGGVEAFKNMTDPVTATYVFLCGFEYCGDPGESFMEANFALSTRTDHAGWAFLNYL